MQRSDLPLNESIIKTDQNVSNQSKEEIKTSNANRNKSTANFTIKKELLKSPYAKLKIMTLIPDRLTIQQVAVKQDTFFIFYNKKMQNYTALWFENNLPKQKILPESQVPVELDANGGLETDNPSSINTLIKIFDCKKTSKEHGNFRHRTAIVNKKPSNSVDEKSLRKYSDNWYMKFEDVTLPTNKITEKDRNIGHELLSVSFFEVIAQELCRLIIPAHPKTRLIPHENKNIAFVVSKEVPGFTSLFTLVKLNKSMNQKGLGAVVVLAIFVNESDFKLENICINENSEVIKFDGDWCFTKARMANKYAKDNQFVKGYNKKFNQLNFDISQEGMDRLPALPIDYCTWNFLDIVIEGQRNPNSLILKELNRSPEAYKKFQYEANTAKLKISLISNELINELVDVHYQVMVDFCDKFKDFYDFAWIRSQKDELITEIITRKEAIKAYSLQQDSFKEFLQNEQTKKIVADFGDELKNFTIIQKQHLSIDVDKMLEQNFRDLSNSFGNNFV